MPYWVYIMASGRNGTLYVGVTNNLARRVHEHRQGTVDSFTDRYNVKTLAYAEPHDDIRDAIAQEKRMKRWPRSWKLDLIERDNPDWRDLFDDLNR